MASNAIKSLRQTLPNRSLRVLVSPTPVTFAERRSVLQALQQFGPIEVFRMAPGYYSNYISVTKDAATAESLVTRSPLSYNVSTSPSKTSAKRSTSTAPDDITMTTVRDRNTASELEHSDKQFTLHVFPEPHYHHEAAMSRSPLSQSWPSSYSKNESFISTTLKQSLPPTVAAKGLAHWFVDTDNSPRESAKTTRLVSRSWLPSAMAKEPAVKDEKSATDGARNARGKQKSTRRSAASRQTGLHQLHGDP